MPNFTISNVARTVDGTVYQVPTLFDPEGKEFILKGFNVNGPNGFLGWIRI